MDTFRNSCLSLPVGWRNWVASASIAAACSLSACATTEVSNDRARPVPPSRVFATRLIEADPAKAHIVVKRDEGLLGSPLTLHLWAEGEKAADIDAAERIDLYLTPGRQILLLSDSLSLTGSPAIAFTCEAGQTQVYRISVPGGGGFIIQPAFGSN